VTERPDIQNSAGWPVDRNAARHRASPGASTWRSHAVDLLALIIVALVLRLLVWHWHQFYPLGGDEQEYLQQALTLLRERRYIELRLMRPPLYAGFLALSILLVDSLVQNLRLVQAVVGTLTVIPIYLLTLHLWRDRRIALVAGLLVALNYTLAATATELLAETVFLLGITTLFWLLQHASAPVRRAGIAGVTLAALALTRSVALPLLLLGAVWLFITANRRAAALFALTAALVIAPWTLRNYLTYHALIIVDTTGAENLWLDNDPVGREAVKQQLYALGNDMATRQQLATERGLAAIVTDPQRFGARVWREARLFFAFQFFDDMRDRPAIWVPPLQVWLRLLLGDGLWLITLLAGVAGAWLAPARRWALVVAGPWALYVLLTALVFHVEARYRLPVYPALIPFAAWTTVWIADRRVRLSVAPHTWTWVLAALTCVLPVALMLAHRLYPAEALMLAQKHTHLWQAERALNNGDPAATRDAATAALRLDPRSALAHVALARADLAAGDATAALAHLNAALDAIPDHPYAHLLRGALSRARGDDGAARADLAYETASLEDLQHWAWLAFQPIAPPPAQLDIGDGLDLGYIRGFHPAEHGIRWTMSRADILLAVQPDATIELRLGGDRLPGAPPPVVRFEVDGRAAGQMRLQPGWQTVSLTLPPEATGDGRIIVTIYSTTYRPRSVDRASADNRELGVAVDEVRMTHTIEEDPVR